MCLYYYCVLVVHTSACVFSHDNNNTRDFLYGAVPSITQAQHTLRYSDTCKHTLLFSTSQCVNTDTLVKHELRRFR